MRKKTYVYWKDKINKSLRYISGNLSWKKNFVQIAIEAGSSPFHFHRNFRKLVGETVTECTRRLRLERSVYLLRKTKKKVIDIALESGYETPEAFTKAFCKAYGIPPTKLKKFPVWNGMLNSPAGIHYKSENTLSDCF